MGNLGSLLRVGTTMGAILVFAGLCRGETSFDTTPWWSGGGCAPLGGSGVCAIGQTFVVPSDNRLHQLTLYIDEFSSATRPVDFFVAIMAWNDSQSRASGGLLFQTGKMSTSQFVGGPYGFGEVMVSPGDLPMTSGAKYVAFFSTIGYPLGADYTAKVGYLEANRYSDGEAVYNGQSSSSDLSVLTQQKWYTPGYNTYHQDLAFKMTFTPEPGTLLLLGAGHFVLLACRRTAGARRQAPR